jgi:hypothetical protein
MNRWSPKHDTLDPAGRRRGQPIVALAGILGVWILARGMLWEAPNFTMRMAGRPAAVAHAPHGWAPVAVRRARAQAGWQARPVAPGPMWIGPDNRHGAAALMAAPDDLAPPPMVDPRPAMVVMPARPVEGRPAVAAAHQLLWMAAVANLPLPPELDRLRAVRARPLPLDPTPTLVVRGRKAQNVGIGMAGPDGAGVNRWSADGWLLLRQGGAGALPTATGAGYGPTYGGDQIGAVLRYRLVPGAAGRPTAYLRGYGALNGTSESEIAFGLSARPFAKLPVAAMVELRASRFANGTTHARPAAMVVSEIPPVRLARGVEAETYVQAGYVSGPAATPFVDGQMRVEQVLRRLGSVNLRAGLGAWGGAQEGVSRIDVGPTARLSWGAGRVAGRLTIDWRVRVAGNAMPATGPAMTLSAGF